jgi:hypothetical protein
MNQGATMNRALFQRTSGGAPTPAAAKARPSVLRFVRRKVAPPRALENAYGVIEAAVLVALLAYFVGVVAILLELAQ